MSDYNTAQTNIKDMSMFRNNNYGNSLSYHNGNGLTIPKKSIRRINELSNSDINLPEVKLNTEKNSDDMLRQLREQLN